MRFERFCALMFSADTVANRQSTHTKVRPPYFPHSCQHRSGYIRVETYATAASAVVFLILFLFLNHGLFRQPIFEWGDFAANALQIQNAKHFHELLGNYSRWGFHHPGPAFFYVFAAGESLFRDALHLVPQAMNAYILTIIIVNLMCLFGAIGIIAQHTGSAWFVPVAVASSLFLIATIDRTVGPETVLSSIWMPHVLLFSFLLYLVCCAAVACGDTRCLPVAVLTGLMLLHGHVAQILFVGTLAVMTLASFLIQRRPHGLLPLLRACRTELLISAALICIFAAPIVADILLHNPSNVDAVRTYMRDQIALPNSIHQAVRYEVSFFTFLPDPEVVLRESSPALFARGGSHPYIVKYWFFLVFLLGMTGGLFLRGQFGVSRFIRYLLLEILVTSLLFLYWTMKMAGGLMLFNGYFFYSVQFLAIFCLFSVIVSAAARHSPGSTRLAVALACAAPVLMFAFVHQLRIPIGENGEINRIATAVQGRAPMIQIVSAPDDWPTAVGVASRLKRAHQPFCFAPASLVFGANSTCDGLSSITKLVLTRIPSNCESPCQVLLREKGITAELSRYPSLQVPFTLTTSQAAGLFEGFYGEGAEGSPMWTSNQASVRFQLAPGAFPSRRLRITIIGESIADRPAEIRLNGHLLGSIAYGHPRSVDFIVPDNWFTAGTENEFIFAVPGAGPVGEDVRHLGFLLQSISVATAD